MATRITVFGSSQAKSGSPIYQQALLLGRLLAEAGYLILNGGYIGTMEAISRGAVEAGGQVIGVTCDQIEAWRPGKVNPWVTEVWHYASLRERLFTLIENGEAYLALPGGVGTLAEVMLTWNLLLTHILPPRPLILIGSGWQRTMRKFIAEQGELIPEVQRQWIIFAPDVDSAFQRLQKSTSNGKLLV